jgi:hypothetical protein
MYYYYLLSMKLSMKYYNYYEKLETILSLFQSFLLISSNVHHHPQSHLAFLLTHFGIYFQQIKQYKMSEIFFIASLLTSPFNQLTLMHYSYLLFSKQQQFLLSTNKAKTDFPQHQQLGYLTPFNPDYKMMKKYLIRATNNPSIMNQVVNESIPTHSHATTSIPSSSSTSAGKDFSASLARAARLQYSWLNELVETEREEKEPSFIGYKHCLTLNSTVNNSVSVALASSDLLSGAMPTATTQKKDHIQSLALHSLGRHYQFDRFQFATAFDYYQKAVENDSDNYMAHVFHLSLSLLLRRKESLTSPWKLTENSSSPTPHSHTSRPSSPKREGNLTVKRDPSKSETLHSVRPSSASLARPASASKTGVRSTNRPLTPQLFRNSSEATTKAATQTLLGSTSQKVLPTTQLVELSKPEAFPSGNKSLATTSTTNLASSPSTVDSKSQNYHSYLLNPLQTDSYYRRSLLLMDNCSYRWIMLLMYADYVCYQCQDMKRAQEYYFECMKLSFYNPSAIWGVLSYVYFLQYVMNDFETLQTFLVHLLKSRHPISSSSMKSAKSQSHKDEKKKSSHKNVKHEFFYDFLHYLSEKSHSSQQNKKHKSLHEKLFSSSASQNNDSVPEESSIFSSESKDHQQSHHSPSSVMEEEENDEERSSNAMIYLVLAYYFFSLRELYLAKQFLMESFTRNAKYIPTLRLIAIIHYYEHDLASANQTISKAHQLYVNATSSAPSFVPASGLANPNISQFLSNSSLTIHNPYLLKTMAMFHLQQLNYQKSLHLVEKALFSPFASISSSNNNPVLSTESSSCYLSYRLMGILYYYQLFASSYQYSSSKENKPTTKDAAGTVSSSQVNVLYERALYSLSMAYQLSEKTDIEALRLHSQILMNASRYSEAKIYLLEILMQKNNDIVAIINLAVSNYYLHYYSLDTAQNNNNLRKKKKRTDHFSSQMSFFYASEEHYSNEKREMQSFIEGKTNNNMKLEMVFHSKQFYHIFLIAVCMMEKHFSEKKAPKTTLSTTTSDESPEYSSTDSQDCYFTGVACYAYFWFGFIEFQQIQQYLSRQQQQGEGNSTAVNVETDPTLKQLYVNALGCFEKCLELGFQNDVSRYQCGNNNNNGGSIFCPQVSYHSFSSYQQFQEYDSLQNYSSFANTYIPLTYYYLGKLYDEIENNFQKTEEYFMKSLEFSSFINPTVVMSLFYLYAQNVYSLKYSLRMMKRGQFQPHGQEESPMDYEEDLRIDHMIGDLEDDLPLLGNNTKKSGKKLKKKSKKQADGNRSGPMTMNSSAGFEMDELNYFSPKRTGLFPNDPNMLSQSNQYFMNNMIKYNPSNTQGIADSHHEEEEEEDEGNNDEEQKDDPSKNFFQTLFDTNDFNLHGNKTGAAGGRKAKKSGEKTLKELFQEQETETKFMTNDFIHPTNHHSSSLPLSSLAHSFPQPSDRAANTINQAYSMSLQQSMNQSLLMKRLLIYQRIIDHCLMKKLNYQKIFKELIPSHSHLPSSTHSYPFLQKYFPTMVPISYVFLTNDWTDQFFYGFSKCEDWNYLLQANLIQK